MAGRYRTFPFGLALVAVMSGAPTARADVVVGRDGDVVGIVRHRALVGYGEGKEELVEDLVLERSAPRLLWIKPFPTRPELLDPGPAPLDALQTNSEVLEPYGRQVRSHVFGPSVVSVLSRAVWRSPVAEPPPPPIETPERAMRIRTRELFTGKIYTSTITRQYVLPDPLQDWLQSQGFRLPDAVTADLASQMNAGDHVAFAILEPEGPGTGPVRVGPTRARMRTTKPLFPTLRRTGATPRATRYEVYVASNAAYVPEPYDTVWEEAPWEGVRARPGRFHTRFARVLDPDEPLTLELDQALGVPLPPDPTLLRSDFRQGGEALGLVTFAPELQMIEIPGGSARGTGWDLFLCILLGLTPLIYTPESWFLLWVGARARDALRQGQSALGHYLWPLYAIGVAVFWVVTLEGTARVAAVLPLLVGILRLAWPTLSERESRVRVKFPSKKKK